MSQSTTSQVPDGIRPGVFRTPTELRVAINPAVIARALRLVVMLLAIVGTLVRVAIYQIAPDFGQDGATAPPVTKLLSRFDLGLEPSLPAWYSSMALVFAGSLLLLISIGMYQQRSRFRLHWLLLSLVFFGLAIDEVVMFHEMLDTVLRQKLETTGLLYFAWVIPGTLFVVTLATLYSRFLIALDSRTRWLFIGSAVLFVGGAIGMELFEGVVVEQNGVATHRMTALQTIEETCEMLGVVLFIYALLDYIAAHFRH